MNGITDIELVLLGTAALLARLGLGLYLAGLSRSKNAAGAVVRTLCDLCVAILAFWALGNAILIGRWGAILGWHTSFGATAFFYAALVLIATGAASGATLERTKFVPPLILGTVMAGVIVPLAGAWAWRGWLMRLGFVDVAGASVLHVCGGMCAMAGAIFVGPRMGKYNRDGSSNFIPGHNLPIAAAGALALAAGFIPAIVGCAILRNVPIGPSAANALLGAAAGGLAGAIFGRVRFGKAEVYFTASGLLAGVVAISAGAGRFSSPAAVLIGAVAGVIVPMAMVYLDMRRRIDDAAGVVAIHLCGGAWGTLAAGLMLRGSAVQRLRQLGIQTLGLAAIAALSLVISTAVFLALRATMELRVSEGDEYEGTDLAEHDLNAYPDFQQTMIKSHHMREM